MKCAEYENFMAFWDKISSRGNIEDRRGSPVALGGGLGLTGLAIVIALNYFSGGSLGDVLSQLATSQLASPSTVDSGQYAGADSYEVFASTVLGSTNDAWTAIFAQNNRTYTPPKLVLFRQATQSACGGATSDVGPHYCPLDHTIYLDETFFDELTSRFGAQGGDVAQAYVIAHEVGHHAQEELGIMDSNGSIRNARGTSNEQSVKLELQADCFAGLWSHSIRDQGIFEQGEINEAMDAAAAVGDDRIQEKVTGRIDPESWTHGSSQERLSWFTRGYDIGTLAACDTFSQ